jgi:hypothetical protein
MRLRDAFPSVVRLFAYKTRQSSYLIPKSFRWVAAILGRLFKTPPETGRLHHLTAVHHSAERNRPIKGRRKGLRLYVAGLLRNVVKSGP